MIKLDVAYLDEVGLHGLPREESSVLLQHVYESLEMRVGVSLADKMTSQQLDEFEVYFDAEDDDGALRWLETNFPDYREIVMREFEALSAELRQAAPTILALAGGRS